MKRNNHLIALLLFVGVLLLTIFFLIDKSRTYDLPTGNFIIGCDTVKVEEGRVIE